MKKYFLIAFLLMQFAALCQIEKMGYSKSQVLNSTNEDPCKSNASEIWYCGTNGSLINYTFKNDVVSSVLLMWEFKTKYEADADVRKAISIAKNTYGRPEMKGDIAYWFKGNFLITISYGYANGKHYSSWQVKEI
jgi:hypothetical protein